MKTLDISQASDFLKISPGNLSQKAREGVIKAAKPGKRWVFFEEDLIDYLRSLCGTPHPTRDEITLCHSTNADAYGGLASHHRMVKEYDDLLGLKANNKLRNTRTD